MPAPKESTVILQLSRISQIVPLFGMMHSPLQLPCSGAGDIEISKLSVGGTSTNGRVQRSVTVLPKRLPILKFSGSFGIAIICR